MSRIDILKSALWLAVGLLPIACRKGEEKPSSPAPSEPKRKDLEFPNLGEMSPFRAGLTLSYKNFKNSLIQGKGVPSSARQDVEIHAEDLCQDSSIKDCQDNVTAAVMLYALCLTSEIETWSDPPPPFKAQLGDTYQQAVYDVLLKKCFFTLWETTPEDIGGCLPSPEDCLPPPEELCPEDQGFFPNDFPSLGDPPLLRRL